MYTLPKEDWHSLYIDKVCSSIESNLENGLSNESVEERKLAFGPNALTHKKGQGPVIRFLLQFNQPLVYILLAATVVTIFLGEWLDSSVIFGVVLVNAVIGYIQEAKALKAIEALARAMTSDATVLRGGEKSKVPSLDLVPGDIVFLKSGDKVPADIRLYKVRELQVDESALTGESIPAQKEDLVLDPETVVADRRNMGYSSTLVTYGSARGVVIATGDRTEIGRINELISSAEILATPLTKKIDSFSRIMLYVILGMAAFTFMIGFVRGQDVVEMFLASVALAVGAIPEGLPAAITITLAIGVSRMAKRNAIIRKLPAVEVLGSTTVICSDKTGTLTQNQMTVKEIYAAGFNYLVSGVGYRPEGDIKPEDGSPDIATNRTLTELLKAGALCNDSLLKETKEGWKIEGDPTEGALIVSAKKGGIDLKELESLMPRVDSIPFESIHQYMATLHDQGKGSPRIIYVKGSIESLCVECSLVINEKGNPDATYQKEIQGWVEKMTKNGLRVLAFSKKEMPPGTESITHEDLQEGLQFLGLQGMIDPPRQEAIGAVEACQKAGILVKMITGDHAGTAASVAKQLGLCGESCSYHTREVLTGVDIAALPEEELIEQTGRTAVFARVSPEQKLRLVEALQKKDNIVAMTGDGVNDAPALRQANIGVAMGITGTEVSKEAADMVLTDDNFVTIKAAVEEGRGIFDNLIKFITWTLPTNGGEGLVILAAILLGTTLPIMPLQILWINMTTALFLGLMLAVEPKEPGIMERAPRNAKDPILIPTLIFRIVLVSFLLLVGAFGLFNLELLLRDGDVELARTLAVNVFVFGEMFYLFNCRSITNSMWRLGVFSNKWLIAGVAMMTLLQLVYTYTPLFNKIFESRPMGISEWAMVIGNSALIYIIVGFEKYLRRK
ncbi:MAG: cation-transporting P-type ATPase [Thermodesulfobacteriota bacterium]|nr:cation-transporting P-type ATPase [Thermodesulfobacteriota bacterium]